MRDRLLAEKAYARLKEMIVANRLSPGDRLVDRRLADSLRMSRTPVRAALSKLERDGLITAKPGLGYFVADLDAKSAEDLYNLREILEVHAVRLAVERATDRDLDELAEVVATADSYARKPDKRREEIRAALRIHPIIARAGGNMFLHDTLVNLLNRMAPFIWMEMLYEDHEAAQLSRSEHATLVALIRDKKVEEAERVIRHHARTAKEHILRILKARETFYRD